MVRPDNKEKLTPCFTPFVNETGAFQWWHPCHSY